MLSEVINVRVDLRFKQNASSRRAFIYAKSRGSKVSQLLW